MQDGLARFYIQQGQIESLDPQLKLGKTSISANITKPAPPLGSQINLVVDSEKESSSARFTYLEFFVNFGVGAKYHSYNGAGTRSYRAEPQAPPKDSYNGCRSEPSYS